MKTEIDFLGEILNGKKGLIQPIVLRKEMIERLAELKQRKEKRNKKVKTPNEEKNG